MNTRADAIEAKRNEILALIRRGNEARQRTVVTSGNDAEPADFVEEQGGIY